MPKIIKSAKGSFTLSSITVDGDGRVVTAESGSAGGVSWQTGDIKTGNFTASADEGYFCNTSGGAFTLTLPSSPSAGNTVAVADYGNDFGGNNLTIGRNSQPIEGVAADIVINQTGAAFELIYVDGTKGWVIVADGNTKNIRDQFITATGGTITCCGDFKVHTFTGPGTFAVTAGDGPVAVVDYLVIAGGGGGGANRAGGGGGGGYRAAKTGINGTYTEGLSSNIGIPVSVGDSIPVTVGDGGGSASNGSNSVFSTITSAGGGAGGQDGGSNGGSGGGGGGPVASGGSGNVPAVFPAQGNDGGRSANESSGGGGGAGGVGSDSSSSPGVQPGGPGGPGATSGINFSDTARAGGGGGGPFGSSGGSGQDGGGNGQSSTGQNATANTGGGGGGGGAQTPAPGGSGGSGLVIIRYKYQ
jgi:hypothetical protein